MVQISRLSNSIVHGGSKPAQRSETHLDSGADVLQGLDALANQLTTADRLLGMRQDIYLEQTQLAQDEQTTQDLITDLTNTLENNPEGFREAMHTAFGGKASAVAIDALATRILSGESVLPANIEFVDSNALGGENALGAYDSNNGGTIYLNRSIIGNHDLLTAVFTEELGHHLDNVLVILSLYELAVFIVEQPAQCSQ